MENTIKILLLEDNSADADLIIRQLKRSGLSVSIKIVETRKMYEEVLDTFYPDIILSDFSMPSFDAVSAFRILQSKETTIPFIIVSGTIGEENAVMLIKDGVTDFASKNNLSALPQKVLRAIKEVDEIKEKTEILQRLKIQTATLLSANEELIFRNEEKEKRAVELQNANTELRAFNFISSHDLQEPLRKIQTFISILLESEKENLSESGQKNLDRIQASVTRMRRLISDLLEFSQISNADIRYEPTDLQLVLEDIKLELKDIIQDKQAIIETNNLCSLNAVVFQFRQLFYNLISNSLKFSIPNIPPRILIENRVIKLTDTKLRDENSLPQKCDYWHISFKDNGIGFDPQFNELIFVMFQRLNRNDEYTGTGIGLAIVKKIVNNHNGIITAKGEVNKGVAFDMYFPIVQSSELMEMQNQKDLAVVV